MARRRKYKDKDSHDKKDLSYKKNIRIIGIDQKELQSIHNQYAHDMQDMDAQINRSMQRYSENQSELIDLKLKYPCKDALDRSVNDIREKYKDVLMYEK